ncbi:MAG: DUF72 domain-containing protein [Chitinophagaceae bacterium]|nr:DUF72 domain-containing protein [Chitinophagaceae bacterium]
MKWHTGCSGFYYREWKHIFYPEGLAQKNWFAYYAARYCPIELNGTFYKIPTVENLRKWYDASPENFSFCVKAPRIVTHYKQLKACKAILDEFYNIIQNGLQEKLALILFQFPPSFSYSEERLQLIIKTLSQEIKKVVEFRHTSWWQQEVYDALRKHHIIFSGISHPSLPDDAIINNTIAYYRFHGAPKLYYSKYDEQFIKKIADKLIQQKELKEIFIYFNNTASPAAIENINWLNAYLKKEITANK